MERWTSKLPLALFPALPRSLARTLALAALLLAGALAARAYENTRLPPPDGALEARLQTLPKGKMRLSELRGKPLLLELWATWCLPCREQQRIVHGIGDELASRGAAVYEVNVGESPKVVTKFLADHPLEYPVLLDRIQALQAKLGVEALPALAAVRADGTVAAIVQGLASGDEVLALADAATASEDATTTASAP